MKLTKIVLDKKDGPIRDFALERNLSLQKAKTEWVLFVDTDEKVSPELEKEIKNITTDTKYDGFYIKRKDYFLDKWLRFGETGSIKLLRLGRKRAGKWVRKVHEYWDIKNAGELKSLLLHYPIQSIEKINFYSEIDAKEFGYFSLPEIFYKPLGKFIQNYFFRLGFLDGFPGFVHAWMMSFQSLVVRVKQYDLFINSRRSR